MPLVLCGACSHAPRVAGEPEGPVEPASVHDRARDKDAAREPDLSVARPHDDADDDDDATETPEAKNEPGADAERGRASFYGSEFIGHRTASGGRYHANALTAAHRTLPFGTRVRVTNLENGKSVDVVINDRGPHRAGRVIDLSRRAAEALDMVHAGTVRVAVEVLDLAESEMR